MHFIQLVCIKYGHYMIIVIVLTIMIRTVLQSCCLKISQSLTPTGTPYHAMILALCIAALDLPYLFNCQNVLIFVSFLSFLFMLCMYFLIAPTAPRSLMIVDVTDTTVTLSWMTPDPPNGIIDQYQIQYRRSDSSDGYLSENISPPTLTYTVTGLTTNTEYEFRVRARTGHGRGVFSNMVIAFVGKLKYVLLLYIIASDFTNSLPETNE